MLLLDASNIQTGPYALSAFANKVLRLESNTSRFCAERVKRQETDRPFGKSACFRQKETEPFHDGVRVSGGVKTSGSEQISWFYLRRCFIATLNGFVSSCSALRGRWEGLVPWLLPLARGPLAARRAPGRPPLTCSPTFRGSRQRATHLSTVALHIWTWRCQRQVRSCMLASAAGHGTAGTALIQAALPVLAGRFQAPCQWASLFSRKR